MTVLDQARAIREAMNRLSVAASDICRPVMESDMFNEPSKHNY